MTKPNNFIFNSDYASLKNDDKKSASIYIGDSGVLATGASKVYESFLTVGTTNAGVRGQMSSDLAPSDVWCSLGMLAPVTVTVYSGGVPVDSFSYNLPVVIERVSATVIRLYAIFYSYGEGVDMQITSGFQTITADVVTFLSPFN
jgi:hypothetical protein